MQEGQEGDKMELLCYTRRPKEDIIYGNRMALSMHLAYRDREGVFRPLHHNEGILYAKAVEDTVSGVLDARSLKNPWIFSMEKGGWGIAAVRTGAEGDRDPDSEGCILLFTSRDLVHYEETGLFRLQESGYIEEVRCVYEEEERRYKVCWRGEAGGWREGLYDLLNGFRTYQKRKLSKYIKPGYAAAGARIPGGCRAGECNRDSGGDGRLFAKETAGSFLYRHGAVRERAV